MSELEKLRWRCRRGTLELDLMLTRYLERRYAAAGDEERQMFLSLLVMEDSELLGYLLGQRVAIETGLAAIVRIIKQLPVEKG